VNPIDTFSKSFKPIHQDVLYSGTSVRGRLSNPCQFV
jgi:hypothetical protein